MSVYWTVSQFVSRHTPPLAPPRTHVQSADDRRVNSVGRASCSRQLLKGVTLAIKTRKGALLRAFPAADLYGPAFARPRLCGAVLVGAWFRLALVLALALWCPSAIKSRIGASPIRSKINKARAAEHSRNSLTAAIDRLATKAPRVLRRARVASLGLLVLPSFSGCSITYVDRAGSVHVLGLAHVVIPPSEGNTPRVTGARTTSVGLAVLRTDDGMSISLGYSNEGVAVIGADSCALIPTSTFSAHR